MKPQDLTDFKVLGVRINAVQIPDVIARIEDWIKEKAGCHFIAVTSMHGIVEAQRNPGFKQILNSADMVVPDGAPLVWLGRMNGKALKRRVYGSELMDAFCRQTGKKYKHFLYGGAPGTPELLAKVLGKNYGSNIVGTFSPPFRALTPEEDSKIMAFINKAQPDIIWVGLSTPIQEGWMYSHRNKLNAPVMIGVGAAFDFLAGLKAQAPRWMREHGLEWFFRLITEPARLWRRYLIGGSKFIYYLIIERLGIKKSERSRK